MRRALLIVVVFIVGTFIGPVGIALIEAAIPQGEQMDIPEKDTEVARLVEVYRAHLPAGRLFMSVVPPPDGKECGYDPQRLFPKGLREAYQARASGGWEPYVGYYALHRWRNDVEGEDFVGRIKIEMGKQLSRFEASFLRRCIQSTVFSAVCSAQVEAFGDKVERFPAKPNNFSLLGGSPDRVVCGYADGVAARSGLPLSPPFNQDYANANRR